MATKKVLRAAPPFQRAEVAAAFAALPPDAREQLLKLRSLIFDTAAHTEESRRARRGASLG